MEPLGFQWELCLVCRIERRRLWQKDLASCYAATAAATKTPSGNSRCWRGHLEKRLPEYPVEFGYLEFATPIIRDGLDRLRAKGVNRVLAVPGMLFAAGHAKNDIPSVLNTYAATEPHQASIMARSLASTPNC